MITNRARIVQRWQELSRRAKGNALASSRIRDLAQRAGFEWYVARGDECLRDFLDYDGEAILRLHGFGKKKLTRLCDILEPLLEEHFESEQPDLPPLTLALESLKRWDVPLDFPYCLVALPIRISHYCVENGITTLGALLGEWERLGHAGFKAKKNLGRKSVDELESFISSLVSGNIALAARFLPIKPDSSGANFAASLTHVLLEQSPAEIEMLRLRLQSGMTLEESADSQGLTRERVRQVEAKFLRQVVLRLEHFSRLNKDLLKAWVELEDWFALVRWNGDVDYGLLAKAALESILRDSPQGVARQLSHEARMEELEDELGACPDLWFGGTSFEHFLSGVDSDEWETFCERLTVGGRFRLDHATGRVHPAKTDLRSCIEAMITEEDDPVPLTWVVELVRKTGYHPTLERIDALRRRSSWRKREGFPDQMILWRE